MLYGNKNPFYDDGTIFLLKIVLIFLMLYFAFLGFIKLACGEGTWTDNIGYYCPPETEPITPNGYYTFECSTQTPTHILGNNLPATTYNKEILFFKGTIASSTYMFGYQIPNSQNGTFDSTHYADGCNFGDAKQNDDFFIVISKEVRDDANCGISNSSFINHFTSGGSTSCSAYGVIPFKWGIIPENDINFTKPIGLQSGYPPIELEVAGNYYFATSTTSHIEGIEVEITYTPPLGATSTSYTYYEYIQFQNKQYPGDSGSFDTSDEKWRKIINWTDALPGQYSFRARFFCGFDWLWYSDWIYDDNGNYWSFSVEEPEIPSMEDYFSTTTDFGLLGNMIRDVLIYLFKPNEKIFNYWQTIKDKIKSKPPFGYYTIITQAFDNLDENASPAFNLQTTTATQNYVFSPLRTGFQWLLWILFGIWLIKRFSNFIL